MACSLADLKEKEVVNTIDGKIMGFISDIEIDVCTGRVLRICMPSSEKYFSFFSSKDQICIPWDCIEKIGSDIILVRYLAPPQIPPKNCR